jgi:hypothetical protein
MLVFPVHPIAGQVNAVRADLRFPARSAPQRALVALSPGVHQAERRSRESGEHAGVTLHRLGDTFAASEACDDELVGVGAVDLSAGRADGGAAVPTGGLEGLVGHLVRGPRGEDLAGLGVDFM